MFPVGFHFERLLAVSATDCTFHGKRRAEATPREVWHHSRGAEHCCVVYLKHGTYRCKAKPAREQPVFRLVHYHRHATRVDDLVLEESIGHRRVLSLIGRRHYKERPGSADPPMHNLLPLYRPARKAFRGGREGGGRGVELVALHFSSPRCTLFQFWRPPQTRGVKRFADCSSLARAFVIAVFVGCWRSRVRGCLFGFVFGCDRERASCVRLRTACFAGT